MKMKTVYEANPALGDPMSIQVNILLVIEVKDSSFMSCSILGPTDGKWAQIGQAEIRSTEISGATRKFLQNGERPIGFDPGMA